MAKRKELEPTETDDDYEIDLEDGIEDESETEGTGSVKFTITSYGADYPVETLVNRLASNSFFVPTFQRGFVWSQRHASRFIESLLMGLPVPGIFLYKEAKTNRHLVVDGQQRLRTLQFFYGGTFQAKKFRLIGVSDEWSNMTYRDLSLSDQRKLDDSIIHATIFQQDEPKDELKSLYFVFERINSGGVRLSPQEIRNCISDGPVLPAVRILNDDKNWRKIFGDKYNKRLKDQELVLRALAMFAWRDRYQSPMRDFLNGFAMRGCVSAQTSSSMGIEVAVARTLLLGRLGSSTDISLRLSDVRVRKADICSGNRDVRFVPWSCENEI
jgi:hypothetical protein